MDQGMNERRRQKNGRDESGRFPKLGNVYINGDVKNEMRVT